MRIPSLFLIPEVGKMNQEYRIKYLEFPEITLSSLKFLSGGILSKFPGMKRNTYFGSLYSYFVILMLSGY